MGLTFVPRSRSYDRVAAIDFETYYDQEYSLRSKSLSNTDYIRHEKFEAQCMGIMLDNWDAPQVYAGEDIAEVLHSIDWSRTAFLAHHTHFDGLIATHHYGIQPAFWLDTLSMSRSIYGTDVKHSHDELCKRLGREGKTRAKALEAVKGMRILPPEMLRQLALYCGDDVHQCLLNFLTLKDALGEDEMRIIDATVRMYTEPVLQLNAERVQKMVVKVVKTKQDVFASAIENGGFEGTEELTPEEQLLKELKSNEKFAAQLRALGVEPPTKISKTTGERTYAFAKNDLDFKVLEHHPDETVRLLVAARLHAKSEIVVSRGRRVAGYAGHPLPIYLQYWAAHTGRWGGGDKVNWQNLPRRGDGAELRKAIEAPENCLLVISDASQIEARLNAWDAGQWNLVDAFAAGVDIYSAVASMIYNKPIELITEDERFVGKTLVLGAGYGAGAAKINFMFKIGQFGPAIHQEHEQTAELLARWRHENAAIVAKWKQNERDVMAAFLGGTTIESGPVVYEGFKGDGFMHLPGGTYVRYPDVWYDPDARQLYCARGQAQVKLYGGILTENRIQALARKLLVWQVLLIEERATLAGIDFRWVNTTHDELMYVVEAERAQDMATIVHSCMSTTPDWANGLPVNAKTEVSANYSKS